MTNSQDDALEIIYRRRAERLARRRTEGDTATTTGALVFGAGDERYALELSTLAEVVPYRSCTPVPGAPAALLGVVNLRGDIRSVVDLRVMLGLPRRGNEPGGYVLILREADGSLGLAVDRIDEVRQFDAAHLTPPPDGSAPGHARLVRGITPDSVLVLDTAAIVAHVAHLE
jgi:chemotaxis signal transduction protein